jgi:hypothetical protein
MGLSDIVSLAAWTALSLTTDLLCAGAAASAQTTASVKIPFSFSADNQIVAAGFQTATFPSGHRAVTSMA